MAKTAEQLHEEILELISEHQDTKDKLRRAESERVALAESHTKLIGALNNRGVCYHFANHYSEEALTLFDSCDLYPCLDDRRMLAEARKL